MKPDSFPYDTSYAITWLDSSIFDLNSVNQKKGKKIVDPFYLGVCGRTNKPFCIKVNDSWAIMVMQSLIVDEKNGRCEEQKQCFNYNCKLNKTTEDLLYRAYKSSLGKTNKQEFFESLKAIKKAVKDIDFSKFTEKESTIVVRKND